MPMISNETYLTVEGDTYETISRIAYGEATFADAIRTANPGIFDPGVGPLFIIIPLLPLAQPDYVFEGPLLTGPGRLANIPFDDPDEVGIVIGQVLFRHWEAVTIERTIDSFTIVSFIAPFEADNAIFRQMFRPLSFTLIQVFVGGQPYFFGRMINVLPKVTSDKRVVEVGCVSYPAVINDVTKALSTKAQFMGNIIDITNTLLQPHAIDVRFPTDEDFLNVFEEVAIKPKTKLVKFLSELAEQRKTVITDNANGDLVYLRVITEGSPVAHLQEGLSPLVSCEIAMSSQKWYSAVTGSKAVKWSGKGTESHTIRNPFIDKPFRPYYFTVKGDDGPVVAATEAKFARMLAAVVTCECEVGSWRDRNGNLFTTNTFIDVTAPSSMIYEKYRFLISKVKFTRSSDKKTCHLSLSLPGSYTGDAPETLPWAS